MNEEDIATVLVVDDQPNVARAYALYLEDDYTVLTAVGGEEALSKLDDSVDIVLLDRRMPDLTGDEVLERIRASGYGCRVAMVTAVDPDFDIVEMDFDAYVTKPVTESDVRETVERLRRMIAVDETTQKQFALAQKRTALEIEKTEQELAASEEYADIVDRLEELKTQVDQAVSDMDPAEFGSLLRDVTPDESGSGS